MQHIHLIKKHLSTLTRVLLAVLGATAIPLPAQTTNSETAGSVSSAPPPVPVVQIKADQIKAKMPPTFYGLMTEEINYSYEGGLYGQLIRNGTFKADAIQQNLRADAYDPAKYYPATYPANRAPRYWSGVGGAALVMDASTPLNDALNVSLKVDAASASKTAPAGVANGGFWGIPVEPRTTYKVSFFAKAAPGFAGPLTVSIEGTNGTVLASAKISGVTGEWRKFEATLKTKGVKPSKENVFKLTTTAPGTIWLQEVSLFPPTYKNRPNGDRADLSQLLADAQPKFLRFPGGNYVEGSDFVNRFNWKQMTGPVEQRPGHKSCWGYWSTDGFGLPEFLGWCQDIGMEPVLAVFAGYTLNHDHVTNGPALEPYVQEALEEIEYVTGDASTKWGAQRIKDGYRKPFPLHYVEIGNEDGFDNSHSYEWRFAQFYDAIKAKYPQLKIIATTPVKSRVADVIDEHTYVNETAMESQAFKYDTYSRTATTKVFVGEWATQPSSPTPNMGGALGDAAWMCCLERNADIVMMHCYAPLFVNVSKLNGQDRSMQWNYNLIGYDALNSYGSPAYYAQQMFSLHKGDQVLGISAQNLPSRAAPAGRGGGTRQIKSLFYSATRDSRSGKITVKIVNSADTPQDVKIEIAGVKSVSSKGTAIVLKAAKRDETNSITDPKHLAPETEKVTGLGASFTRTFPPCSITVLELQAK